MKMFTVRKIHLLTLVLVFIASILMQQPALATPFGQGVFGANNPYGSMTSLTVALGSNVAFSLTPSGGTFSGTGSHTVTVTTNDAVGYTLYAYTPNSSNMVNGSYTIPASGNSTAAALATNTWGYNTDASANFLGMLTTPSLIKTGTGPFTTGDNTTVTYGAITDITKGAGTYTVNVVYTAVATFE